MIPVCEHAKSTSLGRVLVYAAKYGFTKTSSTAVLKWSKYRKLMYSQVRVSKVSNLETSTSQPRFITRSNSRVECKPRISNIIWLVTIERGKSWDAIEPHPNGQTLFDKHLKFCLSSTMFVGLATIQTGDWQIFCACDKQKIFEKVQKHWQANCACQAMFVVVAKRASMFDRSKFEMFGKQCFSVWPGLQFCQTDVGTIRLTSKKP